MVVLDDGLVSLRPLGPGDIDLHLAAVDDEQIDWLWEEGDREHWESLTPEQQRTRQLGYLNSCSDSFGPGPKWVFAADVKGIGYTVYLDANLASPHVPAGQASISYTCHPDHRGQGYTSRSVRLLCRFLATETRATEAHIHVDAENVSSLRVAKAVGATETSRFVNERGRTMVRHVLTLGR